MAELAAGRQPRPGPGRQLIAEGLDDPRAHIKHARLPAHPFQLEAELPDDLLSSVRHLADSKADI
eukprot:10730149-Alexandrium_andersonii.AAC.1